MFIFLNIAYKYMNKYLITFHTHFDAIKYSKFLKSKSIKSKNKPVPRKLSTSCGTCVTFESEQDSLCSDFFDGCDKIYIETPDDFIQIKM